MGWIWEGEASEHRVDGFVEEWVGIGREGETRERDLSTVQMKKLAMAHGSGKNRRRRFSRFVIVVRASSMEVGRASWVWGLFFSDGQIDGILAFSD